MAVWKTCKRTYSMVSYLHLLAIGLSMVGLLNSSGCGVDTTSLLNDLLNTTTGSTSSSLSDLAGTWTGTLTTTSQSQNYQFTVDSSGNLVTDGTITGSVTISSGTVVFTYASDNYTINLQGTLNSDKTKIVMSAYGWTGPSSGSATLSGTLVKPTSSSTSSNILLSDLVGTWDGNLTENGQVQTYKFTVDSYGNFITTSGLSGIATVSTDGMVIFAYSSGGYTGTFQGTINSGKTQIAMTLHTWTGTDSGSTDFTGTLSKL